VTYWLFVFLFDVNGEFQAREMIEAANMEQCEKFAGEYARTIINTQMQAQFYCVSDEEYRLAQDPEV
jgi:hypothetical protein